MCFECLDYARQRLVPYFRQITFSRRVRPKGGKFLWRRKPCVDARFVAARIQAQPPDIRKMHGIQPMQTKRSAVAMQ